jgi:hypothetical protein
MAEMVLWCNVEGDTACFDVSISSIETIYQLQRKIHAAKPNFFVRYDPTDLNLIKVRYHNLYMRIDVMNGLCCLVTSQVEANLGDPEIQHQIRAGQYRSTSNDQLLEDVDRNYFLRMA